jgi:hypothetical protein
MASPSAPSAVYGSETVARTLMGATGQACKVTGFALTSTSALYFANALTSTGVAVIEYLPNLVNTTAPKTFFNHMASKATLGWSAVFWLSCALVSGIVVRKLGTSVSDDGNIQKAETFLYGEKKQS